MKVCLVGHGAFGIKHLEAMAQIPNIQVISLAGSNVEAAREVAQQWKIPHWTTNLAESLAQPELDAVILTTPTPMHAAQGEQCMRAGKHVMIEIPMADSLADAERLVRVQKETGVVAMVGQTRRFTPSHQWLHKKISAGELKILQMAVQTYFFAARISTRSANLAAGPIIFCGITRATRWIYSRIRRAKRSKRALPCRDPRTRRWALPWI